MAAAAASAPVASVGTNEGTGPLSDGLSVVASASSGAGAHIIVGGVDATARGREGRCSARNAGSGSAADDGGTVATNADDAADTTVRKPNISLFQKFGVEIV